MAKVLQNALWGPALGLGAVLGLAVCAGAQGGASRADPPFVRLSSQEAAKLLVKPVPPRYPTLARLNYIQGQVRMEVVLSPQGRVTEAHVVKGHPFLAAAALETIGGWRFRPYEVGSRAYQVLTVVDVDFVLHARRLLPPPPAPEAYLQRQVSPPRLAEKPDPSAPCLRMRVLVDEQGNALDSVPESGPAAGLQEARQTLKLMKFLPAHWGALPVPWYLDVPVHVEHCPRGESVSAGGSL